MNYAIHSNKKFVTSETLRSVLYSIARLGTVCPSKLPDINPCGFWLCSYLLNVLFNGFLANLSELI